ncbi:hypothetical protein [Enterobacter mori]|uniref:hypothetical protein n=1 Tax=Enterobacter mori TaxID=539813 RepID=UPI001B8AF5D6|nr:hypothetical protein [Enterobacter mori]MBS3050423.1 hypothetical protein [Enterobacter mori]
MNLNITPPLAAERPNSTTTPERNATRHQIHQLWQTKTNMAEGNTALSSLEPGSTTPSDEDLTDFIESLRKENNVFSLLNRLLSNQPAAARQDIITSLVQRLKDIDAQEGSNLLKDKFNPAYTMYIASGMLLSQLIEETFSKMGKTPSENDEEDDEI